MAINVVTPVGRLVMGSVAKGSSEGYGGVPLTYKSGPNAGQPRTEWFVGLAIAKDDPGLPDLFAKMNEAAAQFTKGEKDRSDFAWKYFDGDGVDKNGQPYSNREGFAGHFVFRWTTGYQPQVCGASAEAIDAEQIKLGHYIRVAGTVDYNRDSNKPGIYLNMSQVQHCGYGPEIVTGPRPADVFATPVQLPAGASATPLAPAAGIPGVEAAPAAAPVPAAPAPAPAVAPAPSTPATGAPMAPNAAFTQPPGA
jgi:hypothetical protein